MKMPVLAGALFVGVVSVVAACSDDSGSATPSGSSSGGTQDASGGGGGAFCDEYGKKLDAYDCVSTQAAGGFAGICKEVSEKEGACRPAYEALLSCQAKDSTCADGTLSIAPCDAETQAWQACKAGTPQNDAGACTALVADGEEVTPQQEATELPDPEAGGLLKDGTYELTDVVVHTGAGGATGPASVSMAVTFRVAGAGYELVFSHGSESGQESGTIAVNGTTLTLQKTCPNDEDTDYGFTQVDDDTLKTYDATEKTVQTLKRKP